MRKINFKKNYIYIIAGLILVLGIFFRVYNLNWGAPYYFHPDERNIVYSITSLHFPDQMNPKFFAYGSLPIYTIYFLGVLKNFVIQSISGISLDIFSVKFEDAVIMGRALSSLLSILLLFLIYKITFFISNKKAALLATLLSALSVGFIQYSHFLTFEIWLSFFTTLLLLFSFYYLGSGKIKYLTFIGITLGILISVKISSLILLILVFSLIILKEFFFTDKKNLFNFKIFKNITFKIFFTSLISFFLVFITSPYFFLDNQNFFNSINYETNVATGLLPVFYTQSFIDTKPIVYQFVKVYPFILNPFILVLFIIVVIKIVSDLFKTFNLNLVLVLAFFFITFFSQAFLFVKWTRYYIPTLPFIYILLGISIWKITRKSEILKRCLIFLSVFISLIYSFSFFKTVYYDESTIISASNWAVKNIENDSHILSESYDLGITPFNNFPNITLFNFYDLESDDKMPDKLNALLEGVDYVILPSQRVINDRINRPDLYPNGYRFYSGVLGKTQFNLVYISPCDIFCKIIYSGNPENTYETTSNVFDRPTVRIYKK